jgi:1-acyl-sn-glycerol-3-phosphate acyltransferase
MIYDIGYLLLKWICQVFFDLKVIGRENVPRSGPVILASNHVSYLDPILIGVSVSRRLNFLAKEEIFKNPLFSWLLKKLQTFPVSRERAGPSAVRNALRLVEKGKALLLFPEGTRGDGKSLLKAKNGIGVIAGRSGAVIVPVYLEGSQKILPRGSRWVRLHPVTVYFGPPLPPNSSSSFAREAGKKKAYGEVAEQVMDQIERLKLRVERSPEAAA